MNVPARIEALERAPERSVVSWLFFLFDATLLYAIAGLLSPALGAFTPDPGVLLLLALAVRGDARALWSGALAVSAARIAVGVDPPAVVLAGYLAVAAVHSALCAVVDPDRPPFRFAVACVAASALATWFLAVHGHRHPEPTGFASSVSLDLLADAPLYPLAAGFSTGLAAFALVPLLRWLPGVVPSGRRSGA